MATVGLSTAPMVRGPPEMARPTEVRTAVRGQWGSLRGRPWSRPHARPEPEAILARRWPDRTRVGPTRAGPTRVCADPPCRAHHRTARPERGSECPRAAARRRCSLDETAGHGEPETHAWARLAGAGGGAVEWLEHLVALLAWDARAPVDDPDVHPASHGSGLDPNGRVAGG